MQAMKHLPPQSRLLIQFAIWHNLQNKKQKYMTYQFCHFVSTVNNIQPHAAFPSIITYHFDMQTEKPRTQILYAVYFGAFETNSIFIGQLYWTNELVIAHFCTNKIVVLFIFVIWLNALFYYIFIFLNKNNSKTVKSCIQQHIFDLFMTFVVNMDCH